MVKTYRHIEILLIAVARWRIVYTVVDMAGDATLIQAVNRR